MLKLSIRAQEIERQFRSMKRALTFDLEQERANTKDAHVLTGVPQNVLMEWETIANVNCLRMRPNNADEGREVIFIHGGAYCLMSAMTHHRLGGHIANAVKADVIIPDYSLAPEAKFPVARDECIEVVKDRRVNGPAMQILSGDSAGGGLALSAICQLRDQGARLPDGLVLMSPWLDLSLSGEQLQANDIDDPVLSRENLNSTAELYLGKNDARDPSASPLFADLEDLPPTMVQTAEYDLLREDGLRLAARWSNKKTLFAKHYLGMLHSFQMFAGDMPEADQAIAEISNFLESYVENK